MQVLQSPGGSFTISLLLAAVLTMKMKDTEYAGAGR